MHAPWPSSAQQRRCSAECCMRRCKDAESRKSYGLYTCTLLSSSAERSAFSSSVGGRCRVAAGGPLDHSLEARVGGPSPAPARAYCCVRGCAPTPARLPPGMMASGVGGLRADIRTTERMFGPRAEGKKSKEVRPASTAPRRRVLRKLPRVSLYLCCRAWLLPYQQGG
jgi:hypothetical protein